MTEPLLVQGLLTIVGGTATLVVIGTGYGMYSNWLQTKEYEHHTDVLVRILYELRELRKELRDGSG